MSTAPSHSYAGAGLFVGMFAWGMSSVLGPAYVDQSCAMRLMISGGLAAAGLVLVIVGGLVSWRADRRLQAINFAPEMPARGGRIFFARVSMMAAALFGLAILFQLAASIIFNGCER
jgi:hypothetical protein